MVNPVFRKMVAQAVLGSASRRGFATTACCCADFTHAVIGGGAVGLAIARRLAEKDGTSTVLIERNGDVGTETSSRNSEVIHAGLYYGVDTLKTTLCIQGKEMMYALCEKYNIPCGKMGKWIVAQDNAQWEQMVNLHKHSRNIGVPTHFVPVEEAAKKEPFVRAKTGILESPTTGIIDSHSYMQFLLGAFTELGGDVALNSTVTHISPPSASSPDFQVTTRDTGSGEESTISAETLINSAGLGACHIQNMILPESRHVKPFYAKGNYFSYSSRTPSTRRLIYPAPVPGQGGLGTHLTIDMNNQIRFGPDVEWVDDPTDLSVSVSKERFEAAVKEIKTYLPDVDVSKIVPDYCGIRPKLGRASATADGKGFEDFVVRKEEGYDGFINLVGIESPGLTASLAIAERVRYLLYR